VVNGTNGTNGANGTISREGMRKYSFLTSVCHEEHEAYFPTDGGAYLDRSYFSPTSIEQIRGYWGKTTRLIRSGRIPREMGLYIHWPFCLSRCTFCFCAMCISSGRGEMRRYHLMLKREIEALRDLFKGIEFQSIYIGGGTPSLMPEENLRDLFRLIHESFDFETDAEIYMEASPVTMTAEKLKVMRDVGINHVTVGVQSMDSMVLTKTNRVGQTREKVQQAFGLLANEPDIISAGDLMYGLEGQTDKSFLRDFLDMMKSGPRNLRVYAFDPRVQTAFTQAGKEAADNLRDQQWRMVEALDKLAVRFGYQNAPLDPENTDYLSAITRQCRMARKWGASTLGIGMSALSHAFGAAWYGHPSFSSATAGETAGSPRRWEGIPPSYSMESSLIEEMRGFAVRHLHTQGRVSRENFITVFGKDIVDVPALANAIEELKKAGKLAVDENFVRFLSKNRLERQVYCKRFFSPKLISALLRGNRAKYREFNRQYSDEQITNLEAVSDKRVASLMRMYYRAAAPRPDWFRNSMESENLCRTLKRPSAA
jgi:oxygen-independent coproporphyrinogen-3 oxidase